MKRHCGIIVLWWMIVTLTGCQHGKKSDTGKRDTDTNLAGDAGASVGTDTAVDTEAALIEEQVEARLASLTLAQKAGQMVQGRISIAPASDIRDLCLGSIFNGGEEPVSPNNPPSWAAALDALQQASMDGCGIPIFYGIDAVHGNAKVTGSTVFPHNIGLGATRDADLVARVGQATGRECRGVGVHLTFAPAVSVVRDERWGRSYEGFGETPELNAELGAAMISGLQGMGNLSDPGAVAATVKHFFGDGGTTGGSNNGVDELGEATMRAIHLPPYAAAVDEGVASVMPSYHQWVRDGVAYPMTTDTFSLTGILKDELGFDGFVLSDYDAISRVNGGITSPYTKEKVVAAVNAGVDMAMIAIDDGIADFIDAIVNAGIPLERIDDAVRRILRIKYRMGLFDNPYSSPTLQSQIWSPEHQALAREAVQKSLVLLKNDNAALPLVTSEQVVLVGPFADMMGAQAGGWTVSWQGMATYDTGNVVGETIRQGMAQVGGANVTWDENGDNLTGAAKVVVVVGEYPYAEGQGDHGASLANTGTAAKASVYLKDQPHYDLLAKAVAGGAPVILVILSGRPLIIEPADVSGVDAIVAAWLPGSRGIGVADVLYGAQGFTGKLSHTWPATFEQIPINVNKQPDEPGIDATAAAPLYPYGYGLTY